MTRTQVILRRTGFTLVLVLGAAGCQDLTVPNLNGGAIEQVQNNASRVDLQTAIVGIIASARGSMDWYVKIAGHVGREAFALDAVNPEFVTPLLRGTLDPSRFYVGLLYNPRYSAIRLANEVLNGLNQTSAFSDQEKEVIRGFAKMMQASEFLKLIGVFDASGLPIDVNRPPSGELAPVATKAEVYDRIVTLLNEATTHFQAGGSSVPFVLPSGFASVNSPAGLAKLAQALKARAEVYRSGWSPALAALAASFVDASAPLSLGAYYNFSTGSGDLANTLFDPNRVASHGHDKAVEEAQIRADGSRDLRLQRKLSLSDFRTILGINVRYRLTVFNSPSDPIAIIRNEELILLRAEANLGLGNLPQALTDINFIRETSGGLEPIPLATWQGMTANQRLDELLYNKRYSLMWEGAHRWVDMRHYGRLAQLPRAGADHIVWPYFPLPSNECIPRSPRPAGCAVPTPVQ
jgi:hypothetical protein